MFLEDGQGSENVLFDHVDDQIEMRNDDSGHAILIIEVVIKFLEIGLPIIFLFYLLGIIVEVERVRTSLQLLQKLVP